MAYANSAEPDQTARMLLASDQDLHCLQFDYFKKPKFRPKMYGIKVQTFTLTVMQSSRTVFGYLLFKNPF